MMIPLPDTSDMRAYHRAYHAIRRQRILNYLGNNCAQCGTTVDLEVDHIDRDQKKFSISTNLTLNTILPELRKCQTLCVSCHKIKTLSERTSFTHGTMYGWMKKKCDCTTCVTAKRDWYDQRNALRRKK